MAMLWLLLPYSIVIQLHVYVYTFSSMFFCVISQDMNILACAVQ